MLYYHLRSVPSNCSFVDLYATLNQLPEATTLFYPTAKPVMELDTRNPLWFHLEYFPWRNCILSASLVFFKIYFIPLNEFLLVSFRCVLYCPSYLFRKWCVWKMRESKQIQNPGGK